MRGRKFRRVMANQKRQKRRVIKALRYLKEVAQERTQKGDMKTCYR